jgi:GT2 family glycosyltransferase
MTTPVFDPEHDLTVVIPTYNRSQYFLHYLAQGYWDHRRIHLVCDGCDEAVVRELRAQTCGRDIAVIDEQPNRGVAHAIGVGVRSVQTRHFMFCGDDDFNVDYDAFLAEAAALAQAHNDLLFVTMPFIYRREGSQTQVQFDRRAFHGWTGERLLRYLVETGEMKALVAGSLFRTAEVVPVLPEPFFRVSEDYTLLVRLCASYPARKVYVAGQGARMRLIHDASLSSRSGFILEKALMHLVSMTVGAAHLMTMGTLTKLAFARILLQRGRMLHTSYGLGQKAAAILAALVVAQPIQGSDAEVQQTLRFLRAHLEALPAEVFAVWGQEGVSCLLDAPVATALPA